MARTLPCNVCEGKGSYWPDVSPDGQPEKVTCKKCNGTGKFELPELPRPAMLEDEDDEDNW